MISGGRHTIIPDDISCFVDLEFGSFCSIASGLKVISGQHPAVRHPKAVSNYPFFEHGWGEYPPCELDGKVIVGSDVWIGQDVSLMAGVQVGHGATIGACSVVTRNVRPYAVVAGNPASERHLRFEPSVITRLLALAWWSWPDAKIKEELPHMENVHNFLMAHWAPRGSF